MTLPSLFELKPVLMRAFNAAKALYPDRNQNDDVDKDDFVSIREFKPLLQFL